MGETAVADDDGVLIVELKNTKPVELLDLSTSFGALAQSFRDYATATTGDPAPDNLRLYVREIRPGSIIAELSTIAEQAHWILDHIEVLAGFVTNLNDIMAFFIGTEKPKDAPSPHQARQIANIIEPVAKDGGSQMNITINGPVTVHNHFTINSLEANALQNGVQRYVGPQLPLTGVYRDQLMTLEQVKNSAKAKTGDRGIIEGLSVRPVRLRFLNDDSKRRVLDLEQNPFQSIFLVDVEMRSVSGKPALYTVLDVKDVIPMNPER